MASRTSTLTVSLVDDVSKPARTVALALKQAEAEVKAVSAAMASTGGSDRLIASLAKLNASKADIEAVAAAWKDYAKASNLAADSSQWTKAQAAQVAAWERQTVASVRAVTAERRAEGNAQAQMMRQQRTQMEQVQAQRSKWFAGSGGSMAAQLGAAAIGGGAVSVTRSAILAGAELQSERVKMITAGIPLGEVTAAQAQAMSLVAHYTNVRLSEAMETYKELRSVLLKPEETPKMMPTVIAAKSAMNVIDRTGELAGGLQFAIKGAEVLGRAQDPERFRHYIDAFIRAQQVMGKTITPEQQFELAKYLRASGAQLSDRFLTTTGISLAQEMQSSAGKAIDQFVKQMTGGFQGVQHVAAKEFISIGLADISDFDTKGNQILGMKPDRQVKGASLAATDPDLFVAQFLLPALRAAGITKIQDQINKVRRLYPAGVAADLVVKLIQQAESYANHARLYAAAMGVDAFDTNMQDAFAAMASLSGALKTFGEVFTGPGIPLAAAGLSKLAGAIGSFSDWYAELTAPHPVQAAIAADTAILAGLVGGGWLAWKGLSGFAGGFGLKSSAVALDGAALQLRAAAIALKGGAVAEAGAGAGGAAAGAEAAAAGAAARSWGAAVWSWIKMGSALTLPLVLSGDKDQLTAPKQGQPQGQTPAQWMKKQLWGQYGPSMPPSWTPPQSPRTPEHLVPLKGAEAAAPAPDLSASINEADTFGIKLGEVTQKAREMHDAASQTATPQIDTSSIDRGIVKAKELRDIIAGISAAAGVSIPPLGPTVRGNFASAGVYHSGH